MTDLPKKPWYSRSLDPLGIVGCLVLLFAFWLWADERGVLALQMAVLGLGLLGINFLRWRKRS
jgi:hypothetical protein